MPAMGMEDVQMKMEDNGAMEMEMALEQGEPAWPEIACPYCYEYYDVVSLSVHLEEDHPYERHAEPCPICTQWITKDLLISHITMQHDGYLFKNGHRSRINFIPDSHVISSLRQDLQAFLGSHCNSHHRFGNTVTTNISSDHLLSSFGLGFATSDAPEQSSKPPSAISDGALVRKETPPHPWESSIDSCLTSEEREQKQQQATERATFVQGLVLSTLFGD